MRKPRRYADIEFFEETELLQWVTNLRRQTVPIVVARGRAAGAIRATNRSCRAAPRER